MASVSRPYRLINPGRIRSKNPKKRLSLKQKLFFGSARQRVAARMSLKGKHKRKINAGRNSIRKTKKVLKQFMKSKRLSGPMQKSLYARARKKRKKNIGSILTVFNPGTRSAKKGTTMKRRKRNSVARVGRTRRYTRRHRTNPVARRIRRRRYASASAPKRRMRRYSRRRNPSVRRYSRRRNPSFISGAPGKIVGVIGGAALTKLITETAAGSISAISSGFPKYIAGAVVAFLQGKLVSKFMHNPQLGENLAIGGYTYVVLQAMTELLPSVPLPFGLNGMGLLTTSNNWGPPWVNTGSSMTRFVRPGGAVAAFPAPMPATGMHGLGRVRRGGRLA